MINSFRCNAGNIISFIVLVAYGWLSWQQVVKYRQKSLQLAMQCAQLEAAQQLMVRRHDLDLKCCRVMVTWLCC
jgi:hypothetical protein